MLPLDTITKSLLLLSLALLTHTSESFTNPLIRQYHHVQKPTKFTKIKRGNDSIFQFNLSSVPNESELNQQKQDTIISLTDFHNGVWGAVSVTSFGLKSDVLAGVVDRIDQRMEPDSEKYIYQTTTAINLEESRRVWQLRDTFEITDYNNTNNVILTSKIADMNESFDADNVDGSYGMDLTLVNLPEKISGTNEFCKFGVEQCLAVNDDYRVKTWLLYSVADDRLSRVVISHEKRLDGDKDDDATKPPPPSPVAEDDRLAQLLQAMGQQQQGGNASSELELYPMSVFALVSGVWLGDSVIRDHSYDLIQPTKKKKSKGFGFGNVEPDFIPDGFAEWSSGVQKVAIDYRWDYEENVRQRVNTGRSMGITVSDKFPSSSTGTLVTNEMLRTKPREDRLVYVDYDGGAYAGFILGPVLIKAPRYLSFSEKTGTVKPFVTEFTIFQSATSEKFDSAPTLFASRMSRLYGSDGKLNQATTSFFTLDRTISSGSKEGDNL